MGAGQQKPFLRPQALPAGSIGWTQGDRELVAGPLLVRNDSLIYPTTTVRNRCLHPHFRNRNEGQLDYLNSHETWVPGGPAHMECSSSSLHLAGKEQIVTLCSLYTRNRLHINLVKCSQTHRLRYDHVVEFSGRKMNAQVRVIPPSSSSWKWQSSWASHALTFWFTHRSLLSLLSLSQFLRGWVKSENWDMKCLDLQVANAPRSFPSSHLLSSQPRLRPHHRSSSTQSLHVSLNWLSNSVRSSYNDGC